MTLTSADTGVKVKINNWPTAIVAVVGLLTVGAVLVLLVNAGWSGEGIAAFVSLTLGIVATHLVNIRRTSSVEAKTDAQSQQLDTIARQTNGELKAVVATAVQEGIDRAVAKMRAEQGEIDSGH